jgi:hypothetical protein
VLEPAAADRTCCEGPDGRGFWHGPRTIVLIVLPLGTVSTNCAEFGAPSCGDLVCDGDPIAGSRVPGSVTKAAEGSSLVPAAAPWLPLHFGIRITRLPEPCGSSTLIDPVVFMTAVALLVRTLVPVPHGATTTVRAASAVGTTTARVPGSTVLGLVLLFVLLAIA